MRKLLIHGARATLRWARTKADHRSQWIRGLLERRGWNRTAVAVAHKHARIVWALLSWDGVYQEPTSSHCQQPLESKRCGWTGRHALESVNTALLRILHLDEVTVAIERAGEAEMDDSGVPRSRFGGDDLLLDRNLNP